MSYSCRVQHRWTEQISLFIGILSYVLSYNFSFYIGLSYIKHFTIKRANNVRPYTCEPKVCCDFVLCSYLEFVHIRQSPLCKGRCFANAKQRDCLVDSNR